MCEVVSFSTSMYRSDKDLRRPPVFPIRDIIFIFFFFAYFAASTKFIDAIFFSFPPPVDIKKSISPGFPWACT